MKIFADPRKKYLTDLSDCISELILNCNEFRKNKILPDIPNYSNAKDCSFWEILSIQGFSATGKNFSQIFVDKLRMIKEYHKDKLTFTDIKYLLENDGFSKDITTVKDINEIFERIQEVIYATPLTASELSEINNIINKNYDFYSSYIYEESPNILDLPILITVDVFCDENLCNFISAWYWKGEKTFLTGTEADRTFMKMKNSDLYEELLKHEGYYAA